LDPEAWTRRSDLLETFADWQRFDPYDVSIAFDARGLVYRRKANIPGFDGVRLRESEDE